MPSADNPGVFKDASGSLKNGSGVYSFYLGPTFKGEVSVHYFFQWDSMDNFYHWRSKEQYIISKPNSSERQSAKSA